MTKKDISRFDGFVFAAFFGWQAVHLACCVATVVILFAEAGVWESLFK